MKPELEILLELQDIDLQIRKLNQEKDSSPERLKALEERLSTKEAELEALNIRREEILHRKKEVEEELEMETVRLGKSQHKLSQVKTTREYQAMLKEIEEIKKANKTREDEILAAEEEAANLENEIESKQKEVKEAQVEAEAERKHLKEVLSKLESEIDSLTKERKKVSKKVLPNLLSRYDFLKDKRAGIAVASVTNAVCNGCHMNIPPQLFNELLRDDKIHTCPSCQRLIYAKVENKDDQ